jgi:hypothetical protein
MWQMMTRILPTHAGRTAAIEAAYSIESTTFVELPLEQTPIATPSASAKFSTYSTNTRPAGEYAPARCELANTV